MRTEINWNPGWSLKSFIFIPLPSGNERNSTHFLLIRKRPTSRKNSSKFYQRSVISSIYVSLVCRNEPNPSLSFDFDFSQTMQLDNTALAMNKINDRQVEFTKIKQESQCFANLTLIRTSTCPFTWKRLPSIYGKTKLHVVERNANPNRLFLDDRGVRGGRTIKSLSHSRRSVVTLNIPVIHWTLSVAPHEKMSRQETCSPNELFMRQPERSSEITSSIVSASEPSSFAIVIKTVDSAAMQVCFQLVVKTIVLLSLQNYQTQVTNDAHNVQTKPQS